MLGTEPNKSYQLALAEMNFCIVSELILPSAHIRRGEDDQGGRQRHARTGTRAHTHIAENISQYTENISR
jgi:hypothetical protein